MRKLPLSFFARPALVVARDMIGTYLVIKTGYTIERFKITETEAYVGPHDLASHSSKGRTKRTEAMYQIPSTMYVHLIYGMYFMLNIVTDKKEYPAGVLIRGIEGFDGPGKLTKHLGIDKRLYGKKLGVTIGIWIEQDTPTKPRNIACTPRIGVSYAGPVWSEKKYRFLLK